MNTIKNIFICLCSALPSLGLLNEPDFESFGTALTVQTIPPPNVPRSFPTQSRYKRLEERVESFVGVSWSSSIQPETLAKAGFYYVGPGDRVKCGFCGGKLKEWRSKFSPVETHIRYCSDKGCIALLLPRLPKLPDTL